MPSLVTRVAFRLRALLDRALAFPPGVLLGLLRIRYLPVLVERIGHLAFEPDAFVKEGILGMRPSYRGLLCAPDGKVANQHLARYWRRYLTVLSSPGLCRVVSILCKSPRVVYNVPLYGNSVNLTAGYAAIQRAWAGRPPVLELTDKDRRRGWERLQAVGVPRDAWFVCFHSRDEGYTPYDDHLHTYRNSDVMNYLATVRAITDRGGWCVRIGDRSMRKLPPMERMIDYAHWDDKSDWMDVFLCASCMFFLGNTSGISSVSSVFGVPTALSNLVPISALPFGPRDIGIPKLLWSIEKQRYLGFREAFESPVSNYRFTHLYDEAGIRAEENSPEDIRDLALEMLDMLEGRSAHTEEDERMQTAYRSLFKPGHYSYGVPSRVGRSFLQKYAYLLDVQPDKP